MTTAITEYSATEQALAELRQKYETVVFDVKATKGMAAAKDARAELRSIRTTLEKKRVEIKLPALERCRLIDAEAKRITGELAKLEDPIDDAIKVEEARKEAERAEKARLAEEAARAVRASLEAIRQRPLTMIGKSASEIAALIENTKALEFSALPEQVQAEAIQLRDEAIEKLVVMHSDRVSADAETARLAAERAELERQRQQQAAEQAERDRVAREEREAAEAKRQEAIDRQQAELKAERERLAEIDRQQQQTAAAERKRLADEEAERQRVAAAERERLDAERRELDRQREEAAQAERDRLAEQQRQIDQARAEAERKAREQAIANADLIDSAREACELLQDNGFATHLVTLKLSAALDRETAQRKAA